MPVKIAVGMIVFEGDYVLKQCLDQLYPHVDQILISEGPVAYWRNQGRTTSTDRTNEILDTYPDPDKKLIVVHGQYREKDDQSNAYTKHIRNDIDYLWMVDSDEVYKTSDILRMKSLLDEERPTSVGVQSCSFYGGFDSYLTGFELNTDNFLRIFRYVPGSEWLSHRPPTMKYPAHIQKKHITSDDLYARTGIQMYHYSYVFPRQVHTKTSYYSTFVKNGNIPDYFKIVYLQWVKGTSEIRSQIERHFSGVHEWIPSRRGPCFTKHFSGEHPESVSASIDSLRTLFTEELLRY